MMFTRPRNTPLKDAEMRKAEKEKQQFKALWYRNLLAFFVHTTVASVTGGLAVANGNSYCINLTLNYGRFNQTDDTVKIVGVSAFNGAADGIATIVSFSALSAAAHLFLITYGSYVPANAKDKTPLYWRFIKREVNPVRWIEYAFSAALAYMVLLSLSGDRQFAHYALAFVIMWAVMLLGWVQEILLYLLRTFKLDENDKKDVESQPLLVLTRAQRDTVSEYVKKHVSWAEKYSPTIIAWAIFLVVWGIYFSMVGLAFGNAAEGVPEVAYIAVIFTTLLYWSFGFVQLAWLMNRITYYEMEFYFINLSLTAKTQLSLLIYFGLINTGDAFATTC